MQQISFCRPFENLNSGWPAGHRPRGGKCSLCIFPVLVLIIEFLPDCTPLPNKKELSCKKNDHQL